MVKSFLGEQTPFSVRLSKRMAPTVLLVAIAVLNLYVGRKGFLADYKTYFLVILAVGFLVGAYIQAKKIRTVINEVQISGDKFHIIGHHYNSRFEETLDIRKTFIEIQSEQVSKNKTVHVLEIMSEDKFYYLNKSSDWKYSTLAGIVDQFQMQTGRTVFGSDLYAGLK